MEILGLSEENVKKISEIKHEEQWILDYRLKSYELFNKLDMPNFGPKFDLDFDKVIYYKSSEEGLNNNWNDINTNIKCELNDLGVIESEKHLGGMGVQYESEVIYHNMLDELVKKNVIFTSIAYALLNLENLLLRTSYKINCITVIAT